MTTIRSIRGLVALVTGGGSGLGEATARRLVQQGASVVLCDLPSSNGNAVAQELGDRCVFAPTDVTSEEDMGNALKATRAKFHKLDVAVNCAGISILAKAYDSTKDMYALADIDKLISVNVTGTFNVIRLAVGLMGKNQPDEDGQKGVIINTSSIVALDGPKGYSAYAASHGGILGMTLPTARDLACQGIRCCTIATGLFDTPDLKLLPDKERETLAKTVLFPKRLGKPEEFAQLVESIIQNPMPNGCIIRLDGALRMYQN